MACRGTLFLILILLVLELCAEKRIATLQSHHNFTGDVYGTRFTTTATLLASLVDYDHSMSRKPSLSSHLALSFSILIMTVRTSHTRSVIRVALSKKSCYKYTTLK